MGLANLYAQELKAITRGKFAWPGAGFVLLVMMGIAAGATQDSWLDGFTLAAFFVGPLAFIPLTAGFLASPRSNRFVESVFTAPVGRAEWFFAKVLVMLTLAAAYYVTMLPLTFVFIAHAGAPFLLTRMLVWAAGLLVTSVFVGALVGTLFVGQSLIPALGTSMGVLLFMGAEVALGEILVAGGRGATFGGKMAMMSPAYVLKDALGFTLGAPLVPAHVARSFVAYGLVTVGSLALAAWIHLRAQGVETWETNASRRAVIGVAVLALFLAPVALADSDFTKTAPAATSAPAIHGLFGRGVPTVALVDPGAAPPRDCCPLLLTRDTGPLPNGASVQRDLLLFLPVDANSTVTNITIRIDGLDGLTATASAPALQAAADHLESHDYPAGTGPVASDGHHVDHGLMMRVPLTLSLPARAWDLAGNRYPLNATVTYRVASTPGALGVSAAVESIVPGGFVETLVVGAALPVLCFVAASVRWARTR